MLPLALPSKLLMDGPSDRRSLTLVATSDLFSSPRHTIPTMATSPSLPLQSPTTSTASYDFLSSLSASSDDEVVYAPGSVSSDSSSSSEDGISDDDDDFVVLSRARSPCHPAILSPSGESSFSTDDVLSSAISTLSMSQSSAAAFFRDAVAHRFGAERPSLIATVSATSAPQAPVAPKFKPVLTKEQKKKAVEKRKAKKARRKAREAASSTGKFPVVDDASSVASQLTKAQRKKARKAMQGAVTPTPHFPVIDDASSVASEDSTTSTITGYEDASDFITG